MGKTIDASMFPFKGTTTLHEFHAVGSALARDRYLTLV